MLKRFVNFILAPSIIVFSILFSLVFTWINYGWHANNTDYLIMFGLWFLANTVVFATGEARAWAKRR